MNSDGRIALVPVEGLRERLEAATVEVGIGVMPSAPPSLAIAMHSLAGAVKRQTIAAVLSALGLDREDWPTRGGLLDITADLERAANFAEHDGGEVGERLARMLDTAGRIEKALG